MDCAGSDRHADTCPQRYALLDLLDHDLAMLASRDGRAFTRGLVQAEADVLAGAGHPVPRRDRHRWRVRVHQHGTEGVRRVMRRAGQRVAELTDEPVTAGAR